MYKPVFRIATFLAFIPFTIIISLVVSCSGSSPTTVSATIRVQYSIFAQPWLRDMSNCGGNSIIESELRPTDFKDTHSADLVMRIGLPDNSTSHAYRIGTEDIAIIVNPKNPLIELSANRVRGIFTGQIQTWDSIKGDQAPVEVWVFPAEEDIEKFFTQSFLEGSPITSQAHLANNPDEMMQAISRNANAIGLLTSRWNSGKFPNVFTVGKNLPVLAIAQSEPKGELANILACLQKGGK